MKKLLLIGCLILLAACQAAAPEATSTPAPTTTPLPPTPVPVSSPQGASATATLIPTPTFTPEPPPRFFTEEFDSAPAYWTTLYASGDSSRVEVLNENSKLTFELYSPNAWLYAIYGEHEYDTVHIETSVESLGSSTNYIGLICNYQEQNGWYEFNLSSDGSYTVLYGQWLGEGVARYVPIADGSSEYINVGNATNEIGMDCLGDTLQLYINGKLFRNIDVSRFELQGGKVGLAAASFEELPVILSFDWVEVSEP